MKNSTFLGRTAATLFACAALSAAVVGAPAHAAIPIEPGLISFDIDCNCSNTFYQGMVGWDFTVNKLQHIDHLGVYDAGGDGLAVATDVGLWDRGSGALLASATIPQGTVGDLLGQFRYVNIPLLALQPGVTYALGALYNQPSNPDWYQLITSNNSFANWINFISPSERFASTALQIPIATTQPPFGIYGPNIAATPGPLPILGVGAVFGWSRKLRQRLKPMV